MSSLITRYDPKVRAYTGAELRPHFLLTELALRGSAIGAFSGPCRVETEALVDWEDRLENDRIESRSMLHLIGEFFGMSLAEGVVRQRLIMAVIGDVLRSVAKLELATKTLERRGDDLFIADHKLSVSIVTASPVSVLLHVGLNIDATGAPVAAIGLTEVGVEAESFANQVLVAIEEEWHSMEWACAKVRPVMK